MVRYEMVSETLIRHYSDAGLRIEQVETGRVYDDAVDAIPCGYTYRETDEPIASEGETDELQARLEDAETAAKIFLGEAE